MSLSDYPRPKDDNGIGLAFRLNLTPDNIAQGIGWLQQIHAKWTLIAGQDWNQILLAARPVYAAGIMPVCRLIWPIDKPTDFSVGVKALLAAGIPPYVQIWNEPGNPREWRGKINIPRFGQSWADNATIVFDAGGYPGINILGQNEWLAAFNAVKAMDRMDIWSRAWFCLHNGGSNHPPSYPYDEVNQLGTPVTQAEYDLHASAPGGGWASTIDDVNKWRAANKHPGATVMDDDTTVLRFLEFKQWMIDSLGYCLPIIGGEAGWAYGALEDNRYPKIDAGLHAAYHQEMYEWFATGVVSNGDPLPDELLSVSDWIMADWGADDWWYGVLGSKQQTIDAVASIPAFTRQFSRDRVTPPVQAMPVPSAPPTTDAIPGESAPVPGDAAPQPRAPLTYVVQPGDTFLAIAKKFGLTVPTLAVENQIVDPSRIRVGQQLTIFR